MELEDEDHFTGPPLTEQLLREAERALGVRLPASYVDLLHVRNGAVPVSRCHPTTFRTSWADDHVEIDAILGVGGCWGIERSAYLVREWGYPDIGVVLCAMPSGGHDAVMLDYRDGGPHGEPSVAYVDEDRVPRTLAPTFAAFLAGLRRCPHDERPA